MQNVNKRKQEEMEVDQAEEHKGKREVMKNEVQEIVKEDGYEE
jgi:hypothetical protein